ncbi:MAG TPA: SGNH/GDSL hydrolase family protein [Anaerolineales bacterium]|nr:SGNH/GDSL hydrolase family protein [Anaerolineales bacterium]
MKTAINPGRVLVKALCLFIIMNILYILIEPQGSRGSGYNVIFPGRTRLPFGITGDPFTVTVEDVDAMFTSHLISAAKAPKEYRIVLIGDSSVWGEDLGAYEVISEQWNRMNMQCADRTVRAYDLGYPHPSVVKDLVILDKALEYEPDLIVWFVTLNTLISQRVNPFLVANREQAVNVLNAYDISFKQGEKLGKGAPDFYERTLIGQRSNLARRIKLQLLGIIWTATGADTNTHARDDLPNFQVGDDPRYRGLEPSEDIEALLLLSALSAGYEMAEPIPVLIVNEPMFVAPGADTRVRYNAGYPRWAYDQYREAMAGQAQSAGWNYLDLWNAIPPQYFSDAGLHLGAEGERLLIEQINPALQSLLCN